MSIAILTPSRGRPDRFAEMVEAVNSTADSEITIYCALDNDDPTASSYPITDDVIYVRGGRLRLAAWTNRLAHLALGDGHSIIGFLGDDHRPRSICWDQHVGYTMMEQRSGLVYCADGLQNERLPTAPFWSADIIRALGFYYPPTLLHLYADDYWLRLARDIGRCAYLPNVLIEHMHPAAEKAEMDDVYRENDTWYEHDKAAFLAFLEDQHPLALERVKAVI